MTSNDVKAYLESQEKQFESINSLGFTYDLDAPDTLERIQVRLKHMMDMNIHAINEITFIDQGIRLLFNEVDHIEREWRAKQRRLVHEQGEVFKQCGDFTWWNLQKAGCYAEGSAMGHCGNGSGKAGEVVYSLRSKHGEKWMPHVTLILKGTKSLDSAGYTGEIKGYGNQKPSESYHEALVDFLLSERVNGMRDGGYLSNNNFKLSDLSEELLQRVVDNKPSLLPLIWHVQSQSSDEVIRKALLGNNDEVDSLFNDPVMLELDPELADKVMVKVAGFSIESLAKDLGLPKLAVFSNLIDKTDNCEPDVYAALCQKLSEHLMSVFTTICAGALPGHVMLVANGGVSLFVDSDAYVNGLKSNMEHLSRYFDNSHSMVDCAHSINVMVKYNSLLSGSCLHDVRKQLSKVSSEVSVGDIHDIAEEFKFNLGIKGAFEWLKMTSDKAPYFEAVRNALIDVGYENDVIQIADLPLREMAIALEMDDLLSISNILTDDRLESLEDGALDKAVDDIERTIQNGFLLCSSNLTVSVCAETLNVSISMAVNDFAEEVTVRKIEGSKYGHDALSHVTAFTDSLSECFYAERNACDVAELAQSLKVHMHLEDLVILNKGCVVDEVVSAAIKWAENNQYIKTSVHKGVQCVKIYENDLASFASRFGAKNLERHAETIVDGHWDNSGNDASQSANDLCSEIAQAISEHEDTRSNLKSVVLMYDNEAEVDDLDDESLISKLLELDDEHDLGFAEAIDRATEYAEEAGAFDELSNCFASYRSSLATELGGYVICGDEESLSLHIPIKEYIKQALKDYEDYATHSYRSLGEDSNAMFECIVDELYDADEIEADLEVPYYGFHGFSNEAFKEEVVFRIDEFCEEHIDVALAA